MCNMIFKYYICMCVCVGVCVCVCAHIQAFGLYILNIHIHSVTKVIQR